MFEINPIMPVTLFMVNSNELTKIFKFKFKYLNAKIALIQNLFIKFTRFLLTCLSIDAILNCIDYEII